MRPDLHAYLATVLANLNSPAVLINSVADHVHLLFNMGRTVTLAQVVEDVKKSSSKWIKTQGEALAGFAWQAGYGAFSVSVSRASPTSRAQREVGRLVLQPPRASPRALSENQFRKNAITITPRANTQALNSWKWLHCHPVIGFKA